MASARHRIPSHIARALALGVAASVVYYLLQVLAIALRAPPLNLAAIWLPIGFLMGLLLSTAPRYWVIWLPAVYFAHLLPAPVENMSFTMRVVGGLTMLVAAPAAAYVVRRWCNHLLDLRFYLLVLLVACPILILLNAIPLTTVLQGPPWASAEALMGFRRLAMGNLLSTILVAPVILAAVLTFRGRAWRPSVWRIIEIAGVTLGVLLSTSVAFCSRVELAAHLTLIYVPLPFLLWAALRMGLGGASTMLILMAVVATWTTSSGVGPLGVLPDESRIFALQTVLLAICVPVQFLAGVVAERRTASNALAASERLFRTVSETVPEILFTSRPDGYVDYVNPRFTHVSGLPVDDALGRGWSDLLHPEDRPRITTQWATSLATGAAFDCEYRLRCADGAYRWFIGRVRPLRDADGRIYRWVGAITDIDQRKRTEMDLETAKHQAEEASRAKDQFVAILSHELRTPLTPVLLSLASWQEDPALTPDLRKDMAMMRRNIELESRLIDDLLDATRIARDKLQLRLETLDAHLSVRNVLETFSRDIRTRKLHLTVDLAAPRHHVRADALRLQQILWNLIGNAVKYTPEGGAVSVRSTSGDDFMEIQVADTGVGIEPELMERLFKPFEQGEQTLARRYGGLGLGLNISKVLTEMHGGTLIAASRGANQGAQFTVRLPLVSQAVAAAAPSPAPTPPEPPRAVHLHILLVEDNTDTRNAVARLLIAWGHRVTAVPDMASALAANTHFDLVVSDIGLPDGTGWDLIEELRQRGSVRGIALSGFASDEDMRRSIASGFSAHITKPVEPAALEHAIQKAAARPPA